MSERLRLRVLSNMERIGDVTLPDVDLELKPWPPKRGRRTASDILRASADCDYILLNGAPHTLLALALLKTLRPWHRARLVALDILLSAPRSLSSRIKTRVRGLLLRRVHRILLYYRDTSEIQRTLGLPASSFDYMPFKINQEALVSSTPTSDRGYIFCGGKTRRDFKTLIAASEALGYPVKIVTTPNEDIAQHGSYLEEGPFPPNVEVIRLDGSAKPFIELMANSRFVVLPLKPDITGVGIGVYIMAMAMGKCVVISEGPATRGVLTDDLAVVVPPLDAPALQRALERVYTDEAFRTKVASNGQRYALGLGGERRLIENVIRWLATDKSKARA
jgi:glycosyltransferase involved in cell wall biosynthesis